MELKSIIFAFMTFISVLSYGQSKMIMDVTSIAYGEKIHHDSIQVIWGYCYKGVWCFKFANKELYYKECHSPDYGSKEKMDVFEQVESYKKLLGRNRTIIIVKDDIDDLYMVELGFLDNKYIIQVKKIWPNHSTYYCFKPNH